MVALLVCYLCWPEKRHEQLARGTLQTVIDGATLEHPKALVGHALHGACKL
jgi:hypothetical protein